MPGLPKLILYKYIFCCTGREAMGSILVSLADFRHPDVILESGLVPHTYGELYLQDSKTSFMVFPVSANNYIGILNVPLETKYR